MKINAIDIRGGNVLDHEGKLWVVLKSQIYQPGKGASVVQVEMRDVRAGNKTNVRFRTQETVERVRLDQYDFQFLYEEGEDRYTFMNSESFEQVSISGDVIGDQKVFLQENMTVNVEFYETEALNVTLPASVILEIRETEPVVKGQTAASSYKPAIMENGVRVMVPPFCEAGEKIVVRPIDATYIERAK